MGVERQMSLSGIRDALKAALANINGLSAYDTAPDAINVPCAYIVPASGDYHRTFDGGEMDHHLEVLVLVARWADAGEAQDNLDAYLDPTGASSIKAAIEAATLGAHGDAVRVTGYSDYGPHQHGGDTY